MSKDQSPPVRKIIPYKKGGRRQSPFAEMAFQFTGTALDVAIQQRAQEMESEEQPPAETSTDEPRPAESVTAAAQTLEAASLQELNPGQPEPRDSPPEASQETNSPPRRVFPEPEPPERKRPPRGISLITGRKSKAPVPATAHPDLQAFISRWKPFLTDTQIGVCTYIYDNSVSKDLEYCFTSTAKLMEAVSKTERQIKTVLGQLIDWELLIKGETIVNAPREQRGTFYKLNLYKT